MRIQRLIGIKNEQVSMCLASKLFKVQQLNLDFELFMNPLLKMVLSYLVRMYH
jgi:hypothetical protein